MPHHLLLLTVLCILVFCVSGNGVYAFGAGNIPGFAYLEGKAFRHGDIEDTLSEVAKRAGGFALGALIGRGGSKFGGLDIKRVYFGNWLRDYSQAVDVAGLSKLQFQTIVNLCMVLGFMSLGYATEEFEVTPERLGVYLPTEHIDNPKGYPDDAQRYHPKLRGPVDPRELEIDHHTGMKNYIANEHGHWDTSKALVRRTLQQCIQIGRQYRSTGNKADEYEAYRLLGQALHTLEDFAAHSNFCELALVSLGYRDVFVHVGDQVRIQAPDGRWVAPLVTGTFGSSDFIHSLLGGKCYHASSTASVVDLNAELDRARSKSASQSRSGPGSSRSPADLLRSLLFKLPDTDGSGGEMERELEGVERIRAQGYGAQPGSRRPEDMNPQELHAVLWQVLRFRDNVMKKITMVIEKIPGLESLVERISESISVFVFTTLEPFLRPVMKDATSALAAASSEVINKHDQYEVFNDPRASDPTHSFLSKDHFNLILNEPAGHLGKIILIYATTRVVKAWDDPSINMLYVTDDILHCMFHPDFNTRNSPIQHEMMEYMRSWVQGLGHQQPKVLRRLTKQSVRNHLNMRLGSEGAASTGHGTVAQTAGMEVQNDLLSSVPGLSQASALLGKIGSKEERHTSHHNRHGHHGHAHHHSGTEHQHYHPEPQAVPSYYHESHNMTMPSAGGPVAQTSSYSAASAAGYPSASHGYAPPSGPPPFPNPNAGPPSGYAPAYGYAQPMGGFTEPEAYRDQPSGGYGGRAPPPGPHPSGPAFPGGPPGPPPFPEGRGYPPPGGYGW
ncbi:hypothetical protein POSPLADRAFT_1147151 [Postia placenta MAD-698-R-SB12]|uniref:Het-C-domain-containing protein n=1 Tax=Postia placenta MAD-698-R-SB12 TaxID=670580 RepID=A0A1X6MXE0_9APHY|nr:hypothetical protein POSPLADRAFT_1147151 [Postia placenta MAD-698-R-SB12]OSX61045.1 hypothetical protein POSPLADRAFT_1147151 [Postia placenta MAD-698-R-SB12]